MVLPESAGGGGQAVKHRKWFYFGLEGSNSFAASYYFFYLFFLLRDQYGFGNAQNLAVGALHGAIYTVGAWYGGKFAQRAGYLTALILGFATMVAALLASWLAGSLAGVLGGLCLWTIGICFTWPSLEALVSENEPRPRLQRMIGIYNLVWAGFAAAAYFAGGDLKERLGDNSLFWLPASMFCAQLAVALWLRRLEPSPEAKPSPEDDASSEPESAHLSGSRLPPAAFLRMAWLANPLAYVAMNAAGPVFPELARRLHLSTREAGFFCSIWLFARMGTFGLLWKWTGWHYRFRWLLSAYLMMIATFAGMLLAPAIWMMALAQVGFGFSVGLIYYSSLFYSMDVGETKGEHGGIHEAAIGAGVFSGAAVGSAGQYLLNGPYSSTWVVSGALLLGLGCLGWMRAHFDRRRQDLRTQASREGKAPLPAPKS